MSYTKGVLKIFIPQASSVGKSFDYIAEVAITAGYRMMMFNGDIYVLLPSGETVKTNLKLEDFEC